MKKLLYKIVELNSLFLPLKNRGFSMKTPKIREGGEIDLCCLPEWFPAGGHGFFWGVPLEASNVWIMGKYVDTLW